MRLGLALMLACSGSLQAATKVDPAVEQALADEDRVRVIIVTRADPDAPFGGPSASSSSEYLAHALDVPEESVRAIGRLPAVSADVDARELAKLAADPNVVIIAPDTPVPPTLYETTLLTHAGEMHTRGFDGDGWSVAVLDTGVDATHPSFGGEVIAEACFSLGGFASPSTRSLCPNGIDVEIRPGAARACSSDIHGCSHGTHVAGIIAGRSMHSESRDFVGVAPGAAIVAVQVFTRFNRAQDCGNRPAPCVLSYSSDQLRALDWVLKQHEKLKVAAVNMSLGGGAHEEACDVTSPLTETIERLRSKGVPTVIAAGNDKFYDAVNHPGCISSAVTVAATDRQGRIATTYSNVAKFVDFAAPGSHILSSAPGSGYVRMTGTSMAAPHVAGAFALLRQKLPLASALELEKALRESSVEVIDPRTDTALMRMDFGTEPTGLAADVPALHPLDEPAAMNAADLSEVSGLASRRFIIKQTPGGETTASIAGQLTDECTGSSCDLRQIAEGTWILDLQDADAKTIDKAEVESMLSELNVTVFDESALMSAPTPVLDEG